MKNPRPRGETVTVTRRFSEAQAQKRAEARRVASRLAAEHGYDAVTMTAVADRIGVSRATIYRYFASRDHLLAEVMAEWTERINEDLRNNPPAGETPAQRVGEAFERIVMTAAQNPGLTSALLFAATSSDPAAKEAFPSWSGPVEVYLKTLLGDEELPDLDEIVPVLTHVLFSALIALTQRGQDPHEAAAVLRSAARLLLDRRT
ncbi:MAG: TetR family transcriptional regulator [Deltaproteobacteria bacterium]|nr:MAG: TetR family transcriptional regulator [Deltaproteobacteria bacterium]